MLDRLVNVDSKSLYKNALRWKYNYVLKYALECDLEGYRWKCRHKIWEEVGR